MPPTGTRRLSTLTAGRPDGTTSSLSAKLTNQPMFRQLIRLRTATSTETNSSQRSSLSQSHRSNPSHPNEPLHSSCGSSKATHSRPSNAAFGAITPSGTHSITLSQTMSPAGHRSGGPSTISVRMNFATVFSRCVANCLPITTTLASLS